jgi:adenosylcobinamide-GDP ribazoletransferase
VPPRWSRHSDIVHAAAAFPLVGAAIGAAVGGVAALAARAEPPLVAGAIATALVLVITGAIHVDGLADSADALGARDRSRALAIMRDHAVGAYGASAIVLDLLLQAATLGALTAQPLGVTIAAVTLGRASPLPLALVLRYARTEHGTGRFLCERLRPPPTALALTLAVALTIAVGGSPSVAMIAGAATATAALGWLCHGRIGGMTGDTLGATVEIVTTTCLLIAVAFGR